MSVHLDIGKRYRNHRDNVMTDEDISQRKQGEMRSSTRPCKRGLDKVWIAQAERLEGDLGNNWSLEAWAGTQLPSIDLPAFPDPGSTV